MNFPLLDNITSKLSLGISSLLYAHIQSQKHENTVNIENVLTHLLAMHIHGNDLFDLLTQNFILNEKISMPNNDALFQVFYTGYKIDILKGFVDQMDEMGIDIEQLFSNVEQLKVKKENLIITDRNSIQM